MLFVLVFFLCVRGNNIEFFSCFLLTAVIAIACGNVSYTTSSDTEENFACRLFNRVAFSSPSRWLHSGCGTRCVSNCTNLLPPSYVAVLQLRLPIPLTISCRRNWRARNSTLIGDRLCISTSLMNEYEEKSSPKNTFFSEKACECKANTLDTF